MDSGATGGNTITSTANHPFWVPDLRQWVNAIDLQVGQLLRTSTGTYAQITAITHYHATTTVHNLTITNLHTYYVVAGNTPILVHNDSYVSSCRWTTEANLFTHFDKHVLGVGKEGGVGDMADLLRANGGDADKALEAYEKASERFLYGPVSNDIEEIIRDFDGARVRVNIKTGKVGVVGDVGIVTYYRSDNAMDDFLKEITK